MLIVVCIGTPTRSKDHDHAQKYETNEVMTLLIVFTMENTEEDGGGDADENDDG